MKGGSMPSDEKYAQDWKQNQENSVIAQCYYWIVRLEIAEMLQDGPKHICVLAHQKEVRESSLHRVLQMLARRKMFVEIERGVFALTEEAEKLKRGHPHAEMVLDYFGTIDDDKEWWISVENVLDPKGLDWDFLIRPDL